jgi:hypothetical protein
MTSILITKTCLLSTLLDRILRSAVFLKATSPLNYPVLPEHKKLFIKPGGVATSTIAI